MKRLTLLFLTVLFCGWTLTSAAQVQPLGTVIGNQTVVAIPIAPPGYAKAQALVYYPDDYFLPENANKRYPLYVFLHGAGEGTTNNITQVTNTSLPNLIKNGLKPYGIDPVTKDTIKFIVVSPHAANTGSSYYYPQLQYTIPYLFTAFRVDTSCVWVGGLSAGARGTWSVVMGTKVGDTALGKRITGIMPMANGGYDDYISTLGRNLDTVARRGLGTLYTIGTQDPGYNNAGFFTYQSHMKKNSQPARYYDSVVIGGTHSTNVWNPPFPLTARVWSKTMNSWTQMWTMRRTAVAAAPAPPAPAPAPAPAPVPPTVSAGSGQTITLPASTVTLSGNATPASGTTITGYTWSKISGPSAVITNAAAASTSVTSLMEGTYIFDLKVTASNGTSASGTVQVTVNPAPVVSPDPVPSPEPAPAPVPAPAPPAPGSKIVTKVACTEYKSAFLYSDSVVRSFVYNNATGHVELMPFLINGRKAVDVSTGFNVITILDDQGYIWLGDAGKNTATRWNTDTTGAAFNGNLSIYGYFYTYLSIRNDGSIWYWGGDDYKFYGGKPIAKPIKIPQPAGVKFVKLATGSSLLGLTSTGDVYQWNKWSTSFVKVNLPRPASDIVASHMNFFLAVVPDNIAVSTMGYPYAWGSESRYWGGDGASYTPGAPVSIQSLWKLPAPIKRITANHNVIHYIDANGDLFGIGDNPNGEIGNGEELVNHAEKYPTPYAWSWVKYEMLTGAPAIHVSTGTKFKEIFTGSSFVFYHYALDTKDSLYFWGRNKSFVGGDGAVNNQEVTYPNAMDVLTPSMRTPLGISPTQTAGYNFNMYTLKATPKQTITGTTATLSATATPTVLTSGGRPNYGYAITKYQWTKVSGPASFTITSPNSISSTVTELVAGTYVFSIQTTDNNTGTITAYDTIVVNSAGVAITTPPTADAGVDQIITLPTNSTTLTGVVKSACSIRGYRWTQTSGPNAATLANAQTAQTTVSGLATGSYAFKLTVTDSTGQTASDSMAVVVNPALVPALTVDAGADQTITYPSRALLTGTATATNSTVTGYQWVQVSGPGIAYFMNSRFPQTQVTGLVAGIYVFKLMISGSTGLTASDRITVTVNAGPAPTLTVNAGTDQTVILPNRATVTGTGVSTNSTIVSYQWTQVSGPATAYFANSKAAQSEITGLTAGTYVFRLTATGSTGLTATDDISLTAKTATTTTEARSLTTTNEISGQLSGSSGNVISPMSFGLPGENTGAAMRLFPNPATAGQQVTIEGTVIKAGTVRISIYDLGGRMVKQLIRENQSSDLHQAISLAGLVRGVYMVSVQSEGRTTPETLRIVIQ